MRTTAQDRSAGQLLCSSFGTPQGCGAGALDDQLGQDWQRRRAVDHGQLDHDRGDDLVVAVPGRGRPRRGAVVEPRHGPDFLTPPPEQVSPTPPTRTALRQTGRPRLPLKTVEFQRTSSYGNSKSEDSWPGNRAGSGTTGVGAPR